MENVFAGSLTVYGEGWTVIGSRNFNDAEKAAIRSTAVTDSKYGKSVCFYLRSGGQSFIPLSKMGNDAAIGSSIDMNTAKLVKLHRDGDGDILRVEL